jgi:hypothetical protein
MPTGSSGGGYTCAVMHYGQSFLTLVFGSPYAPYALIMDTSRLFALPLSDAPSVVSRVMYDIVRFTPLTCLVITLITVGIRQISYVLQTVYRSREHWAIMQFRRSRLLLRAVANTPFRYKGGQKPSKRMDLGEKSCY